MRRSLVLCLVIITSAPPPVHADEDTPSRSAARALSEPRPEAPRHPERAPMRDISVAEAAASGILSAGILTAAFMPYPVHEKPRWQGGILFDDGVRDAIQLRSPSQRALASTVSDALVSALILAPVFVDALLMAGLVRGDPELMARMLLIDLQAHAFAQGLTAIFKHAVGRERPASRGCREDPQRASSDPLCDESTHTSISDPASFFSGHSSLAFTSAALICLHHTEQGLFGPVGDAAACATGMALATTVGLLRIAADRHYASDVLIGAGVGVLSGWLVPWLFHYDVAEAIGMEDTAATLAPMVDGDKIGVQIFGYF